MNIVEVKDGFLIKCYKHFARLYKLFIRSSFHYQILLPECNNTDGVFGFYFSHNGKWFDGKFMGWITKDDCEVSCGNDCIAFSGSANRQIHRWPTHGKEECYHYYDKNQLVNGNKQYHVKRTKS